MHPFGHHWRLFQKYVCMLIYQMGMQINDQISIARKLSKVKLCCAFSLKFGLKRVQIARNIAKFGVHACIQPDIQIHDQI